MVVVQLIAPIILHPLHVLRAVMAVDRLVATIQHPLHALLVAMAVDLLAVIIPHLLARAVQLLVLTLVKRKPLRGAQTVLHNVLAHVTLPARLVVADNVIGLAEGLVTSNVRVTV